MLFIILFLIVGSILVYISKFNFMPVSVDLGVYVFSDIPLFYVIIGSLLIGLVLSYLVHLFYSISNTFTLRGKNNEIKNSKASVLELTKRVHQLELEKEKLSHRSKVKPKDPDGL